MVLFFSTSFLRRLRMLWRADLTAFLIGDRNLFFFTPDSLMEVETIDPRSIDAFYREKSLGNWQLLGFLSPSQIFWQSSASALGGLPAPSPAGWKPALLGYAEVNTNRAWEPARWNAYVHLLGAEGPERRKLELRIGASETKP